MVNNGKHYQLIEHDSDRYSPKNTNIILSDVLIITDLNILIIHETDLNETDLRLQYLYTAKIYSTYTLNLPTSKWAIHQSNQL